MKALLISIRPQWVELILNLIKKDEIRKGTAIGKAINKLIEEQGVALAFIYCTKALPLLLRNTDRKIIFTTDSQAIIKDDITRFPHIQKFNGKVVARFNATAEEINHTYLVNARSYSIKSCLTANQFSKECCLEQWELDQYLKGEKGTAIHINDLEIFDKPKEISEFYNRFAPNFEHIVKYCEKRGEKYTRDDYDRYCEKAGYKLTRAPQSYCFIEI